MKRFQLAAVAAVALCAVAAVCQPPDDGEKRPGKKGPPFGPPPFRAGKLLPPHIREELDLTDAQEDSLDALEREVRVRLLKILTPEQKRKLEDMRRRGPGKKGGPGGPPDGKGGPRRKKGGPDGPPDRKGPRELGDDEQARPPVW